MRDERRKERGKHPLPPKQGRRMAVDTLQVTPGTMFMLRLKSMLNRYVASTMCGDGGVFASHKPIVLISAADVSGEGEVKLSMDGAIQASAVASKLCSDNHDARMAAEAVRTQAINTAKDTSAIDKELELIAHLKRKLVEVTQASLIRYCYLSCNVYAFTLFCHAHS